MSTGAGLSTTSPIKFGTSGWRGVIAEDFTFANVRLALTAIAEHVKARSPQPSILVGYDTRFYSEEFSQLAVDIPPAQIDPAGLENALLNLAINARDAMPRGGTLLIATAWRDLEEEYLRG